MITIAKQLDHLIPSNFLGVVHRESGACSSSNGVGYSLGIATVTGGLFIIMEVTLLLAGCFLSIRTVSIRKFHSSLERDENHKSLHPENMWDVCFPLPLSYGLDDGGSRV
jgi:hypothetical protein